MINSVLTDNHADIGGGGGYFFNSSNAALANLTFWRNSAGSSGGAVYIDSCLVSATNCILWEDSAPSWPEVYDNNWQVEICYCDIQGGWPYCEGNIDCDDPLFIAWSTGTWTAEAIYDTETGQTTFFDDAAAWIDGELVDLLLNPDTTYDVRALIAANTATTVTVWGDYAASGTTGNTYEIGDYHLSDGSPCIEVGDPGGDYVGQTDIDGQVRVWDGDDDGEAIVDIGADEFRAFAPGDMNCDGMLDGLDIGPFMLALMDPTAYAAAYPACDAGNADCNGDGLVDANDAGPFAQALLGG